MRKSAAKRIDAGLTKAHRVITNYIAPQRKLDAEKAMHKLLRILDGDKFIKAWAELQEEAKRPGNREPGPTDRLEQPRPPRDRAISASHATPR
jgi:hypothetical protein